MTLPLMDDINSPQFPQRGRGRCAANEIFIGSTALISIIREGKIFQISSLMQTGTASGMQSMDSHLARLVREEEIPRAAAYEKAMDNLCLPEF